MAKRKVCEMCLKDLTKEEPYLRIAPTLRDVFDDGRWLDRTMLTAYLCSGICGHKYLHTLLGVSCREAIEAVIGDEGNGKEIGG